uniref:ATP-dependent DNA helicase n=1 Tax=Anopheles melas TaxID=34690 RepID=A0A182UF93_9DIPT
MCTASILNLCAISLDRYVAVTRPVTYPSIMSTRRAKSLIAGLWVLSFVICFPPLVGWKEQKVLQQCIRRSMLWGKFRVLRLREIMRVQTALKAVKDAKVQKEFVEFLLCIGESHTTYGIRNSRVRHMP